MRVVRVFAALLFLFAAATGWAQTKLPPQEQAVKDAMNRKDLSELKRLLDFGFDVANRTSDGASPLHWVARSSRENEEEIAEILIRYGARVNLADGDGQTPLMLASEGNRLKLAKVLIAHGADVSAVDKRGDQAIHKPVRWQQYDFYFPGQEERCAEMIRFLAKNGADIDARSGLDGSTPLGLACGFWHYPSAKMLLSLGADVHARDFEGNHPLTWPAVWENRWHPGEPKFTKLLLGAGAKPDYLELAALGETQKALEAIPSSYVDARRFRGRTALMVASSRGDARVVRKLLDRGADINLRDKYGHTAMHYATGTEPASGINGGTYWDVPNPASGRREVIRLLLRAGAQLDPLDNDRRTPLDWSVNVAPQEAALELLSQGAKPNSNTIGDAIMCNQEKVVAELLKQGDPKQILEESMCLSLAIEKYPKSKTIFRMFMKAGVSAENPYALRVAAGTHLDTVKALVEAGANVNRSDEYGYTPVLNAKNWEIFKYLESKGADILYKAPDGYSALFIDDVRIARYMLGKGADPNQKRGKRTAITNAAGYNNFEMVKLLLEWGADPWERDESGHHALYEATRHRNKRMIALLNRYRRED